jgi:myo-inositol-1(or 4)-monophosphatase
MKEIITVCRQAALQAGALLKSNFGNRELHIEKKVDQSLVTNIDKEAERIIVSQIKSKYPSHSIIGEESGRNGTDSDYIWIIDPLDGTHNFIRGINMFGVSIGVVHQNQFVAGVIYLPAFEELYAAEYGSGAYKNDRKIKVSDLADLSECTIAFDSNIKKAPQKEVQMLQDLAAHTFNIRMFGTSVRQLTYLAEGVLDGIVEFDDHPWDYTAGACIVAEAGGMISNLRGGPLTYKDTGFFASNGRVHQEIQVIVQDRHS